MSTFLQICQDVARESGTIQGTAQPSSVAGQTGRLNDIVEWVKRAWTDIQNIHSTWRWMRGEIPSTALTIAGTARYTGVGSWSITDFAEWVVDEDEKITIYDTTDGVSDTGEIEYIEWGLWRQKYGRGTQTNNRPIEWSISPDNEMAFGPIPDDEYRVEGPYRETVQTLSANGDIPNCPVRFHDIIKWKALIYLGEYDESTVQVAAAMSNYGMILAQLERDQLPQPKIKSEPLA